MYMGIMLASRMPTMYAEQKAMIVFNKLKKKFLDLLIFSFQQKPVEQQQTLQWRGYILLQE